MLVHRLLKVYLLYGECFVWKRVYSHRRFLIFSYFTTSHGRGADSNRKRNLIFSHWRSACAMFFHCLFETIHSYILFIAWFERFSSVFCRFHISASMCQQQMYCKCIVTPTKVLAVALKLRRSQDGSLGESITDISIGWRIFLELHALHSIS